MTDPLDLTPIQARRYDALDADVWTTEQLHDDDRRAITTALNDLGPLLAEVKRLRAHLDDDRISRSEYAERTGFCPDCGQPIQPGIA